MSEDEKCQRCGELGGGDLRTLWMARFYAMDEMLLPFSHVQIHGQLSEKIGESIGTFGPIHEFAEPEGQPHNYRFFTLRVCKSCRADWMTAIREWFHAKPQRESCGSGIFVRRNGANVEITEEEWRRENPGREPVRWKS